MKIALASDHGGFGLKEKLLLFFKDEDINIVNLGTYNADSVDYPIYGEKLANAIIKKEADFGIAICGTGIGMSIICNKIKGIRAALCTSETMGRLAKEHNDANIIALGGRITDFEIAKKIVCAFINTSFKGNRHQRRLNEIAEIENE